MNKEWRGFGFVFKYRFRLSSGSWFERERGGYNSIARKAESNG